MLCREYRTYACLLSALAALAVSASESQIYYWKNPGSTYQSFGDKDSWLVGTSSSGAAATTAPGADDWIHVNAKGASEYFDLDGSSYSVKGVSYQDWTSDYGSRTMVFRNGSLTFTEDFYSRQVNAVVQSGGCFVLASDCNTRFGWSGAVNKYTVNKGGQFDVAGTVSIGCLRVINSGLVNFDPAALYLWDEGYPTTSSWFDNSGTMNFPNGLAFVPTDKRTAANANETQFLQKDGTMTFGGPITIAPGCYGSFTFALTGGTLEIGGDVSLTMSDFASVGMPTSGTTATIDLGSGSVLDWSNATFAEGTTLNVTGSGKIILGLSYPTTLNAGAEVTVERVLLFVGAGLTVNELPGWESADFVVDIDFEHFPPSPLFTSTNPGILAKYFAAIDFPAGWSGAIEGNSVVVTSRPPATFSWLGGTSEKNPLEVANWSLSDSEGATRENPYDVLPTERDYINYGAGAVYRKFYFGLGGGEMTVGGWGNVELNWYTHDMSVANGTLTFAHSFSNRYISAVIKDTGKLVVAAAAASRLGFGSALSGFTVRSGGELSLGGSLVLMRTKILNEAGGKTTINPTAIGFAEDATGGSAYEGRGIFNSGDMALPRGLGIGGLGGPAAAGFYTNPPELPIRQIAGTLTLGGDIAALPAETASGLALPLVSFSLEGGALVVTDDVTFASSLASCTMIANASATATISAGKTLDMAACQFAGGTSLSVSGGTLVLGATAPSALALGAGTGVRFAAVGLVLATVTGAADTSFSVTDAALVDGAQLVLSADAELLETIAGNLTLPTGWEASVSGGAVCLAKTGLDRPSFSCTGEVNLSDPTCWQGPAFAENVPVYVSGEETVAILDSTSPSISKITVRNGATLKIAEAVATLPELEASLDAKIVIATGVTMELPPIAGLATSTQLPVVEIATGAVVTVAADYAFKNVRLDFFGELRPSGNVWFGTAEVGETAYFGMRWIGGTLNYPGNETLSIACPKGQGGRVACPEGVYLKDVSYLPAYAKYYSFNVGYLNPPDEPFDVVVDGCYLDLRGNRSMYFGGAAAIKCVNGGGFYKHDAWRSWGLYGRVYFQGNATLELDGRSYVYYVYNQTQTFSFEPATADAEQLVLKNGSYFAVHTPSGNSKAAARVENAYYDVLSLQVDAKEEPRREWTYDAFAGFTSVNVPADKFLCIRSSEAYIYGVEWDRELAIDAPIAGQGSLIVSNATALADVKAALKARYGAKAPEHYPARGYGMRAIVKRGTNTATGEARAVACEENCQLVFADGSNWAGTLVADEHVAFTNLTAGGAAAATFGTLRLTGRFPLRVWKEGDATAADAFAVTTAVINGPKGRLTPVPQDGYRPQVGDSFAIGSIPADAALPAVDRRWSVTAGEAVEGRRALTLTYEPKGLAIIVR